MRASAAACDARITCQPSLVGPARREGCGQGLVWGCKKVRCTPQQTGNGTECGVFVNRTAEYRAGGFQLDFNLESIMAYERDRLTLELFKGQLLA